MNGIKVDISLTGFLAAWGAFLATLVFFWDIYKWKTSGPKLLFDAEPNMRLSDVNGISGNDDYVLCSVKNIGDRQTTITHLGYEFYKNRIYKLLNRPEQKKFFLDFPEGKPCKPLPYVLEPGREWTGLASQKEVLECGTGIGICMFFIYAVHKKKPIKKMVKLKFLRQ